MTEESKELRPSVTISRMDSEEAKIENDKREPLNPDMIKPTYATEEERQAAMH